MSTTAAEAQLKQHNDMDAGNVDVDVDDSRGVLVSVVVNPASHSTDLYSVFNKFAVSGPAGSSPALEGAKSVAAALRALGWDVDAFFARDLAEDVDLPLERGLTFPDFTTLHKGLEDGTLRAPRLAGFDASRGRALDRSSGSTPGRGHRRHGRASSGNVIEHKTPQRREGADADYDDDSYSRSYQRQRTPASRSAARRSRARKQRGAPPTGRISRTRALGRSASPRVGLARVVGSSPRHAGGLSRTFDGIDRGQGRGPAFSSRRGRTASPHHRMPGDTSADTASGPLAYYQRQAASGRRAGVNGGQYSYHQNPNSMGPGALNRSVDHVRDHLMRGTADGAGFYDEAGAGTHDHAHYQHTSGAMFDDEDPAMGGLPQFRRGAPVRARFGGFSRWFDGVIARVRQDGTYDIDYNDGDREVGVPAYLIQRAAINSTRRILDHASAHFGDGVYDGDSDAISGQDEELDGVVVAQVGQQVRAQKSGSRRWNSATVLQINELGEDEFTYDLLFTDGEELLDVPADCLRAQRGQVRGASSDSTGRRGRKKKSKKKKGKRSKKKSRGSGSSGSDGGSDSSSGNSDSATNSDGASASSSGHGHRRHRRGSSHHRSRSRHRGDELIAVTQFDRGLRVQCRWNRNWFPGKILRAHGDGSYDVLLRDGDLHRHVDVDDIRVDQEARNSGDLGDSDGGSDQDQFNSSRRQRVPRGQFAVHQRVEVNYEGMGKYFRGRIDQAYANGVLFL